TAALLKHLPTPGLDVRILFGRVRDDVFTSTARRQEPFMYGSLGGSGVTIVAPPATPPVDTGDPRSDYQAAENEGTLEALGPFPRAPQHRFLRRPGTRAAREGAAARGETSRRGGCAQTAGGGAQVGGHAQGGSRGTKEARGRGAPARRAGTGAARASPARA